MKTFAPSRLALLACAALFSLSAQAHHPWLVPSASVTDNPQVTIDAAVSEDLFEFDAFPLQVDTLRITAPDGSTLAPDTRSAAKRRVSFDVTLPQKGSYRISAVSDTSMASWKDNGETKRWRGATDALAKEVPAGAPELQVSRMLQRVETFVSNDEPGPLAAAVVGSGIELVPLTSPTDLSAGDTSRFRLLLDGKPYPDADVTVIRGGNRYRYKLGEIALKTNAAGEFSVTWDEPGRYWLGASHGKRGGPGGPGGPQGGEAHKDGEPHAPQGGPGGPGDGGRRESYAATFEVLPK